MTTPIRKPKIAGPALAYQQDRCAAEHFGPWAIEPKWFDQAVSAFKAGALSARDPQGRDDPENDPGDPGYEIHGDVAVVPITGAMTKRPSSFAGASTLRVRQALRAAAGDSRAASILLLIDSPGGTVAGTGELARDVADLNADAVHGKPVDAYIDDLGASAAYWVASGARRVYANDTAQIGSIGVFMLLSDTSGRAAQEGITVHLVNTGPNKGAFSDTGVPIPEHKLAAVQREVDGVFGMFRDAVVSGRGLTDEQFNRAADGSVFIAATAQQMGLIDAVGSLESTLMEIQTMNIEQFQAFASENPEAVAKYIEQGKKAGAADQLADDRSELVALLAAAGGDHKLAHEAFVAGRDADQVKTLKAALDEQHEQAQAQLAAKDAELEKLRAQVGEQDAVGFQPSNEGNDSPADPPDPKTDPQAAAEAQWQANADGLQDRWISKEVFLAAQVSRAKQSA